MYSAFGGYCNSNKIVDYPNVVRDILFENKQKLTEYETDEGMVVVVFFWKNKKFYYKNRDYVKLYKQIYQFIKKDLI